MKLMSKITLLPFLCITLIYFLKTFIDFQFIITFALFIILLNKNKIKYSFILTLFYSLILSFLVLILSIGIGKVIYIAKDEIFINLASDSYLRKLHIIPKSIISPFLMFYAYNLLFKIEKTTYYKIIKWSSIFVLIMIGLTDLFLQNKYLFISWQFIMALALQLILHEKEIFKSIERNNNTSKNGIHEN